MHFPAQGWTREGSIKSSDFSGGVSKSPPATASLDVARRARYLCGRSPSSASKYQDEVNMKDKAPLDRVDPGDSTQGSLLLFSTNPAVPYF